jgi:hypothetical protein
LNDPTLNALARYKVLPRRLREYVRGNTEVECNLRDVYNFKRYLKRDTQCSENVVDRVQDFLKKLPAGSLGKAIVDEKLNLECICIQTPLMQKLFAAYPETILMDTTYLVNSQGYGLFTLMVTDACGRGRPIFFALLSSESQNIFEKVFDAFKESNNICNTTTVMLDKDFVFLPVVKDKFPNLSVRICQFHAIKYLSTVICEDRFGIPVSIRKKLRPLFTLMCRSSTEEAYDTHYVHLLSFKLSAPFMDYLNKNWHMQRFSWVYCWTTFFSVGNTTNNSLESFHASLKKLIDRRVPIDELLCTLMGIVLCIHEEVEHVLLKESQSTYKTDCGIMKIFATHYTRHVCNLIKGQLDLSESNEYECPDHASVVINSRTRKIHECTSDSCSCPFLSPISCRAGIYFISGDIISFLYWEA